MRDTMRLFVSLAALSFSVFAADVTWVGAVGSGLAWEDGANWSGAQAPGTGDNAIIDNGGSAVISGSAVLNMLNGAKGELLVTGGGQLDIADYTTSYIGRGADNEFTLNLEHGTIAIGVEGNLYCGSDGGTAIVNVGGIGESAVLDVRRDIVLCNSGKGDMQIGDGGSVCLTTGWFYIAIGNNAVGEVTISSGGSYIGGRGGNYFVMARGSNNEATLTLDGGLIDNTGDFWMVRDSGVNCTSKVYLNSGTLLAKSITSSQGENSSSILYMNGATVGAVSSTANFINSLSSVYIQSGGVVFDIPEGMSVTIPQALLDDSAGTIVKSGGGTLKLTGANTFTGGIDVQDGYLIFDSAGALPAGYAGTVSVASDAGIGYNVAGGATALLALLDSNFASTLLIGESDAGSTIDLSGHPNLKAALYGFTDFTGIIYPVPSIYRVVIDDTSVQDCTVSVSDNGGSPTSVEILAKQGGGIKLYGASSYTGTTLIDGADVRLENASALGSGGAITLRNGASLRLNAVVDVGALVARVTGDSEGGILIGANNAAANINLTGKAGVMVGTAETDLIYGGTITPAGQRYLLGGGKTDYVSTPNHGITLGNLADNNDLPTEVVIGAKGMVELKSGNSYSGGTVVTNRGVLFLVEDGLGAVPATHDPMNLYVDNGVVRSGQGHFFLHANRGVTVGPGGMELHPWGGQYMTVEGDLNGSGAITMTDSGNVIFAGVNNSYDGTVSLNLGGNLHIGNGEIYSWSDEAKIVANGSVHLNANSNINQPANLSGSGALRKKGSGIMSVRGGNAPFMGHTYVDGGAVYYDEDAAMVGDVTLAYGTELSFTVDDFNLRSLNGYGTVNGPTGATLRLGMGSDPDGASAGVIDPVLKIVKQGSGEQALRLASSAAVRPSIELLGGTLTLTGGGRQGLRSRYYNIGYDCSSAIGTFAGLNALIAPLEPSLIGTSYELGDYLDSGSVGANFPPPYNDPTVDYFIAVWDGEFYAEVAGEYKFAAMSDDSTMIYFGDTLVLDYNGAHWYGQDKAVGSITLQAGWHPITIVFQDIESNQGITVWVTPPGATEILLPNSLMSEGFMPAVESLVADSSSARLNFDVTTAGLHITSGGEQTIHAAISGGSPETRLIKDGALTLTSNASDYHGTIEAGATLAIVADSGVYGTPVMGAGAMTLVQNSAPTAKQGLGIRFYNFDADNPDYTPFANYDQMLAYFGVKTPDYIGTSASAGETLDFGSTGTKFPYPYGAGGLYQYHFEALITGQIYIEQAGTYRFSIESDDGSVLYIGRQCVIDSAWDKGLGEVYGSATLRAGWHEIAIAYRQNGGGYALTLRMGYPDTEGYVNVPQAILRGGVLLTGISGPASSTLQVAGNGVGFMTAEDSLFEGAVAASAGSVVTKEGAATLTLLNDNAGSAATYQVNEGTLSIGNGGTSGDLGLGNSVSIGAGGILAINRSGTLTFGHVFEGSGRVSLDGSAEVSLTNVDNFGGTLQVNNGSLNIASGNLNGGASLEVWQPGSANVDLLDGSATFKSINGDGSVRVTGGTINSIDASEFDGDLILDSARLETCTQFGGAGNIVLSDGTLGIYNYTSVYDLIYNDVASPYERGDMYKWFRLTPAVGGARASVYLPDPVEPTPAWVFSCYYEAANPGGEMADGFAMLVHNDERGTSALGEKSGHLLAMDGIVRSIGISFNIYGTHNAAWVIDGVRQAAVGGLNGISLTDGVDIVLEYDGSGTLTMTLSQGEKSFVMTRSEDLATFFGGSENPVYAGMTGATGGTVANQFVRNMVFRQLDAAPATTSLGHTLVVAAGKNGKFEYIPTAPGGEPIVLAGATLGSGSKLEVGLGVGASDKLSFTTEIGNISALAGSSTVVVAPAATLAVDTITFGEPGAALSVSGALSAPSGSVTVVLPLPLPTTTQQIADFSGATWADGVPEFVFVDTEGNPLKVKYSLHGGILRIFTSDGTVILLR